MRPRDTGTPQFYSGWRVYRPTLAFLLLVSCSSLAWALHDSERWQTAKGTTVLFRRTPEPPMVDIRVVFDAGSARDGAQWGLAALTNGMLAEGAGGLTGHQISEGFEGVGAQFENGSARDMAWLQVRSLSEPASLQAAVSGLARVLQHPDFPAEALQRERSRMLTALEERKQDPGALAEDAFFTALYPDHPYGPPPHGTPETVVKLEREHLQAFYRRYYTASNAVIAIVGDVDRARAEQLVEAITGELPRGAAAPTLPEPKAPKGPQEVKINYPSAQTHLWVGRLGMARVDPDYVPLYVGNHALGGGGFVSRLYKKVREERGLSYSVYSYFMPMRVTGPFVAALQTASSQAPEALSVLKQTMADVIRAGPTVAEHQAAVKNLTGGFPLRIDSNREIVEHLVLIGFYGLPADYLETLLTQFGSVTREAIREALARRIPPTDLVTVSVGPDKPPASGGEPIPAPTAGSRHLGGGGP
ncbi:MAG: M16 family metallopeptidase [Gammaproteobacteria bacterium]